ncbi:MAG: helix-hairpin-helix domain-containing protein [Bacteroidia bacterium]|nr:helix-hairpin-helix domain-containing protein [Bacteroidia bacterium]
MSILPINIKGLSRKQRIGALVMIILLASFHLYNFIFYPIIFRFNDTFSIYDLYENIDELQLVTSDTIRVEESEFNIRSVRNDSIKMKSFDPNRIDSIQLVSFNLPRKITRNWLNYRNKGGRFYNCNDLKKIYGMDPLTLDSLLKYCQCRLKGKNVYSDKIQSGDRKTKYQERNKITKVNINTADSLSLTRLKGIGPVLARRIVKYRTRLGGFHQLKQLVEVYGVEDSVLLINKSFLTVDGPLDKININKCDYRDLIRHFYFDKSITNAILKYRKQHGTFDSIQQLKNIRIINDSIYLRINSYLET